MLGVLTSSFIIFTFFTIPIIISFTKGKTIKNNSLHFGLSVNPIHVCHHQNDVIKMCILSTPYLFSNVRHKSQTKNLKGPGNRVKMLNVEYEMIKECKSGAKDSRTVIHDKLVFSFNRLKYKYLYKTCRI